MSWEQEQQQRDEALFRIDRIEWLEWHIKCMEEELEEHREALKGMYPKKEEL